MKKKNIAIVVRRQIPSAAPRVNVPHMWETLPTSSTSLVERRHCPKCDLLDSRVRKGDSVWGVKTGCVGYDVMSLPEMTERVFLQKIREWVAINMDANSWTTKETLCMRPTTMQIKRTSTQEMLWAIGIRWDVPHEKKEPRPVALLYGPDEPQERDPSLTRISNGLRVLLRWLIVRQCTPGVFPGYHSKNFTLPDDREYKSASKQFRERVGLEPLPNGENFPTLPPTRAELAHMEAVRKARMMDPNPLAALLDPEK